MPPMTPTHTKYTFRVLNSLSLGRYSSWAGISSTNQGTRKIHLLYLYEKQSHIALTKSQKSVAKKKKQQ